MSIELHCPQCKKMIRAPDAAGGKRGKCPYCQASMYIPLPPDDDEEIGLAPIDKEQERHDATAQADAARVLSAMAHEKAAPAETADVAGEDVDVDALMLAYVSAMHQSKLDDAQSAVKALKRAGAAVRDQLRETVKTAPPKIQGIPDPLVAGFLKTLLSDLG